MIGEEALAELIFSHVDDSVTWCRLAQVSKRFNKVSKRKLIQKEVFSYGKKEIYTILPANGLCHGVYQVIEKVHTNAYLQVKCTNKNGQQHGLYQAWFNNGQLFIEKNYVDGQKYGRCRIWYYTGQLQIERHYKKNEFHGLIQEWSEKGILTKKTMYINGTRH